MDYSDLRLLNKISNTPNLNSFLHLCVDELIHKKQTNVNSFNSTDVGWTKDDYEKVKSCVQKFYSHCAIGKKFELDDALSESLKETLRNCYEIRRKAIFQSLTKEFVLQNGYRLVENFDWRLKWILGSSSLTSLKEPILQVDFICSYKEEDKTRKEVINFEANLMKVDALIAELAKIKKEIAESSH